jgi:hypothetical protein
MKIADFQGIYQADNIHELETILMKRYGGGFNSFWLSYDSDEYPQIGLLVKGDLAYIHYFPKEYDAGFTSVGTVSDLPGETTIFHLTKTGDDASVLNEAVLPFSAALRAAKEFFSAKELPTSVDWERL